ncbi:MAG: anion permease [Oscillospiraceae bacterium]|nr:anion permease [Oscillospiraceae bacterium]
MSIDIISVIIVIAALILFSIKKIPMWVSGLIVMLAAFWTGCMAWGDVSAGFSNKVVVLIAAMSVIGAALVETGLGAKIGNLLMKFAGDSEKKAVLAVLIIGVLLGVFVNGSVAVGIMMPVVDCLVIRSRGKITRKALYFPMGIAPVFGNGTTSFSASSMLTCVALLTAAGYREIQAFEPLKITGVACVVFILFYYFVIYPMSKKQFDYPDPPYEGDIQDPDDVDMSKYPVWKQWVAGLTMIGVVIALISGANYAAWPLLGVVVVVLTGCISPKKAINSVNWGVIITVAASLGFGSILSKTGGGEMIAKFLVGLAGPLASNHTVMTMLLTLVAALISVPLADGATVAVSVPIAISICTLQGWDAVPIIIAMHCGLKICQFMSPVCTGCVTQCLGGGYRGKDFLKLGGLISLVAYVCVIAMIFIFY